MSLKHENKDKGFNKYRLTDQDLATCIYKPQDNGEVLSNNTANDVVVFTINGKDNEKDKDDNPILWDIEYEDTGRIVPAIERGEAFAYKKRFPNGNFKFFIKMSSGNMINPLGKYDEFRHLKRKKTGEPTYTFKEVAPKVFSYYLNFLKTKNTAWLAQAQREKL